MFGSMRSKIIAAALSELTLSERLKFRLEQFFYVVRSLVANSGFVLFVGMQVLIYGVLSYRTNPFSDALIWNLIACIVLSTMSLGDFKWVAVRTDGANPYLPLNDRQLLINGIWSSVTETMVLAVYSAWAIAAALSQSGLAWYAIIYFAVVTVVGQCAISILLAESPIAKVLSRLSDFRGIFLMFLLFPMAAIGILFVPEQYWPSIAQVSPFAWFWPPAWPTLIVAQSTNWGFAVVGITLSMLAVLGCGSIVAIVRRKLDQNELIEFEFSNYGTEDESRAQSVAALIVPKDELELWRVTPEVVAQADKLRFDVEEFHERHYSEEQFKKGKRPSLSILPEATEPESLFRALFKLVHTPEEVRLLAISRSCQAWESDLLNVYVHTWFPRVAVLTVALMLVPQSFLFFLSLPACLFATRGIWPHVLFDKLSRLHTLPIDPLALLRAEIKYRLVCLVPIVLACIPIGAVCAFRDGATLGEVAIVIAKIISVLVVAMPVVLALGFVVSLNSAWVSFRALRFGTALTLTIIVGIAGIGSLYFSWFGLEFLGIIPAAIASWTILRLCVAWYGTGPTDVAVPS